MSAILKRCATCKRLLPATTDHFQRRNSRPNNPWVSSCKECINQNPVKKVSELVAREGFKVCRKCRKEKPATLEHFARSSQTKDGLRTYCKECDRDYRDKNKNKIDQYAKEYREINKTKIKQDQKQYRIKNKRAISAKNKKWRDANADRIKSNGSAYREKKKEEINARVKKWRKNNPEKIRVKIQRRRAQKVSLPDTLTAAQWERCLTYFDNKCAACGRPSGLFHSLAADHWIPLTHSDCPGTVVENMVPLCHGVDGCNNSKNARPAAKWLTEKFGKRKGAQILKRIEAYFEWAKQQE